MKLHYGVGNVQKKCWIRVAAVQPMAKEHIGDLIGRLPAHLLEGVHTDLAEYTGQV
ncbi:MULTISPECIES: hypothetical protein [unclassified Nocardiopsis]|uniref:hypothetical protein n=1 Tax=Nocardiopsis TaxID=2013 RepID=UPI00387AF8E2